MTEKNNQYSVLIPLWHEARRDFVEASLSSMLEQTVPPSEILLITEYKLSSELEVLVLALQSRHPAVPIRIICEGSLAGRGLGAVLAYGVEQCGCPLIARMDSDDISFPDRCEKELAVLEQDHRIAVVGGGVEKFSGTPENIEGYRFPPREGRKLRQYSKFRSPFNHPTVMFRKEIILRVGNYSPLKEGEDYELWYRILREGYKGYNLQEPVLHYRAGEEMLKRRRNKTLYRQSLALISVMRRDRYIGTGEMLAAVAAQSLRYGLPTDIYKTLCRFMGI